MSPAEANRMKQLAEQNKKYKRQIQALKRTDQDADTNNGSSDEEMTDAGDQFGGKAAKHSKKKAKKDA